MLRNANVLESSDRFWLCYVLVHHAIDLAKFSDEIYVIVVIFNNLTPQFPIGRLRPNFLDVCQPAWGDLECATEDGRPIYVTEYACQGNLDLFGSRERADYEVEEARMSFPSGHATHSFQAVTFMILYLQVCLLLSIQRLKSTSDLIPEMRTVILIDICIAKIVS